MHGALVLKYLFTYKQKKEFERGGELKKKDSLIPLFSSLGLKIVFLLHGCMRF